MDKITMADAELFVKYEGYTLFHINWFTRGSGYGILHSIDLMENNPDCSHALIHPNKRWIEKGAVAALVLEEKSNGS